MALRLRALPTIGFVVAVLTVLVFAFASCGGGAGGGTAAHPSGASAAGSTSGGLAADFTLKVFGGTVPTATEKDLTVTASQSGSGETTVEIRAENARDISSALMHLKFDPAKYAPVDVVQGPFFGKGTLFFSLTDKRGYVPIGVVIENPASKPGVSGSGLIATIRFADASKTASLSVDNQTSRAPTAVEDKVQLVDPILDADNYPVIDFYEIDRGDGNNDGEVGITDLQPIALYYNQTVPTYTPPNPPPFLDIVNYNITDQEINIADLQPLANNYSTTLLGYDIEWTNDQVNGPWTRILNPNNSTALATIRRVPDVVATTPVTTDGALHYVFKDNINPALVTGKRYYRVTPIALNGDKGIISTVGTATGLGGYTSLHITPTNTQLILTEKTQTNPDPTTWEPFAKKTLQLQCMGTPIGGGPDEDVTASAQWIVVNNDWAASVGNATGTKGLVTGIDRGIATVRAYAPHRLDLYAEINVQVCTIDSILVKANGSTSPVTVPLGGSQQFTAQGVFSDGGGGASDSVNEDLTTLVNWLQWPTQSPPNHGIFIFDSLGILYLTDANLQTGDSELVFSEFPTVDNPTLNFGYKATSNTIQVTAG
jgi:hypothetical protein